VQPFQGRIIPSIGYSLTLSLKQASSAMLPSLSRLASLVLTSGLLHSVHSMRVRHHKRSGATNTSSNPMRASASDTSATFSLRMIPNAEQRLALCNDGSPAGFYYAPPEAGLAEDPPVWVLYQQGGNWCWDDESCRSRSAGYTSSTNWPSEYTGGGIFEEGRLGASAHRIYLRYCTSDGYLGNRTGPLGWHFRGRPVVTAVIEEMAALGMGSVQGTRLIYGGCSAGARGAYYNIDWLQTLLPSTVSLRGYFDSPLWIELDPVPLLGSSTSLRAQCEAIAALHGDALDEKCVQAYGEPWRCLLAESSLSLVETPSLVFAHQDDSFQIGVGIGSRWVLWIPSAWTWWTQLRARTIEALKALPSRHAVFSYACYGHCVSTSNNYNTRQVQGQTLQDAVEQFVFEGTVSRTIQQCSGFDCCADS